MLRSSRYKCAPLKKGGFTSRFALMSVLYLILFSVACQSPGTDTQADAAATPAAGSKEALVARAASFELDTSYESPPGDPLEHHAAGFAKILCSAVFITGLDVDFAAEAIGYFSAPYEPRKELTDRKVDHENKAVHVTLPNGVVRTAKYYGDQGCVALPKGEDSVYFTPVEIEPNLPDPAVTPWPIGDVLPDDPLPPELDAEKVQAVVDAAFEPAEGLTAAFVVTWKGRLIGERYREGFTMHTPLESWSMGKSLTATLMGILIHQGEYELYQPAPVPEWQEEGDPHAEIRIADIMRMSSGLRFRNMGDPEWDPAPGYPDHLYVYTGTVNSFEYAATRPQQWPPNTIGRYRNSDPVLTHYLVRLAVERRGDEYLSFPQRELFDKIGIRNLVAETDPYGDFLLQGYEFGTGRDWAIFTCKTASGTASGSCLKGSWSSWVRLRPLGKPTVVLSTEPSSGSTGRVLIPSRRSLTTWPAPGTRRRSSYRPTTSWSFASATTRERSRATKGFRLPSRC